MGVLWFRYWHGDDVIAIKPAGESILSVLKIEKCAVGLRLKRAGQSSSTSKLQMLGSLYHRWSELDGVEIIAV